MTFGIDGCWARDGARMQYWLARNPGQRVNERPGAGSTIELGLVVKRHPKDAETNTSGCYSEYDVLLIDQLVILSNISVISLRRSRDSGDEATLVACTDIPQIDDPTQARQNILSSDGDLVVVAFIGGTTPIILGTINHVESGSDTAPWHGDSGDGVIRAIHHNETHATIHEDSTIDIDMPDNVDVTVTMDSDQVLKLSHSVAGSLVEAGGGSEQVILGTSRNTDLNIFLVAMNTFVAAVGGLPGMAGPAGTFQTAISDYQMALPGHLSDVLKTD